MKRGEQQIITEPPALASHQGHRIEYAEVFDLSVREFRVICGSSSMNEWFSRRPSDARFLLVSDFDGTITERDFFDCALAHIDTTSMPDYWNEYIEGRRTHFEALQGIFSHLRGGEEAIAAVARQTNVDAGLRESLKKLRTAGWDVVVVSAGCRWYIDRLLAEHGVELTVVSNPGRIAEDGSLEMSLPEESMFFSPEVGVDKAAVVRWALQNFEDVAFAGDGRPDEIPARQVKSHRRFARGWLADRFERDGTPFQPFDRWPNVADALTASSGG